MRAAELAWLQPGRSAELLVGADVAGWLGEVHPSVLAAYECSGPVSVFEVLLEPLLKAARGVRPFVDLPRFPGVKADIAIVVDEAVTAEHVEQAIRAAGGRLIYIETSNRGQYAPTRGFYERCGYQLDAVLKDFYGPGDDKCIFVNILV